jgi:hypothetical protein
MLKRKIRKKNIFLIGGLTLYFVGISGFNLYASSTNTTFLPDTSVMANIRGTEKERFGINEVALEFEQYLYPDVKANIILSFEREGNDYLNDVEEGYVSFLNPIDDLTFKVGKKKINFGLINAQHAEDWTSIHQPGILQDIFGQEGAVGQGGVFSYLLPLPIFTMLEAGAWNYGVPESIQVDRLVDEGFSSRIWTSFPINEMEFSTGLSGIWDKATHNAVGLDLSLRKDLGSGKKWYFIFEWINFGMSTESRDSHYAYLGYTPNKYWELGLQKDKHEFFLIVGKVLSEKLKCKIQIGYGQEKNLLFGGQIVISMGSHQHTGLK